MREPIARLVKDGEERLVHTRAELVELKFNGWREVKAVAETIRTDLGRTSVGGVTAAEPDGDVTLPAGADVIPGTSLNLDPQADDDLPTDES